MSWLAYAARVAIDTLRFAIKQLDRQPTAEERQNTASLLLDALDWLAHSRFAAFQASALTSAGVADNIISLLTGHKSRELRCAPPRRSQTRTG